MGADRPFGLHRLERQLIGTILRAFGRRPTIGDRMCSSQSRQSIRWTRCATIDHLWRSLEAFAWSRQSIKAMSRTPLIWASILFGTACVAIDLWFATARCSASPPLYVTGIVIGLCSQLIAVALPMFVARHFPSESLKFQLRSVGLGAFLVVTSAPVLLASLLYSDGIGKDKSYHSVGFECHGPALIRGRGI